MDEYLARLNRIYPNGKYVSVAAYDEKKFKNTKYDSSLDSKVAENRWKTSPLTYEEAQECLAQGKRVGWVVPKGYVIIDIDNKDDPRAQETILKILEKFEVKYSYNYTSKGIHLLFRDPKEQIKTDSRMKCGLNIVVDTRANESGYIVLPSNDPHRAWGEWGDFVEDIPYFLKPVLRDTTPSFIGMQDGDGRNDSLYRWRTKLEQCHKLSNTKDSKGSEIEKCIRIINENCFATPIPNKELFQTVLRDKNFEKKEKETVLEKENIYNNIANDIIGKYDLVSYYSNFYKFNGTYYKPVNEIELERIIHFEVSNNINKQGRKEILEFLKVKTQIQKEDFDKQWNKIACKNGVLNLVTGELEQPNKSEINTIFIPFNYNPDPPYSRRIDQFMVDVTNGDVVKMQFLYQIAGYCLLKKNLFEKFFICKGEGGTGKSTYTNLLHKMVGGDINCSHISIADFDKDYYLASTVSKLLNIDDDVADGKILENTGRFKSIISGNVISVRQIYKEVMDFVPYITCIFSCNKLPRIMDKTTGLYRRMVLIELNHKVENPDPLFMEKVTDLDMEYFLFKAVDGIKTAIEEGKFRITQSEHQLLLMFKRRQNPLNEWLYETNMCMKDIVNCKCIVLYKQFIEWCDANGYSKQMTNFTFKEDICALFGVEMKLEMLPNTAPIQKFVKDGPYDPEFKPF